MWLETKSVWHQPPVSSPQCLSPQLLGGKAPLFMSITEFIGLILCHYKEQSVLCTPNVCLSWKDKVCHSWNHWSGWYAKTVIEVEKKTPKRKRRMKSKKFTTNEKALIWCIAQIMDESQVSIKLLFLMAHPVCGRGTDKGPRQGDMKRFYVQIASINLSTDVERMENDRHMDARKETLQWHPTEWGYSLKYC